MGNSYRRYQCYRGELGEHGSPISFPASPTLSHTLEVAASKAGLSVSAYVQRVALRAVTTDDARGLNDAP